MHSSTSWEAEFVKYENSFQKKLMVHWLNLRAIIDETVHYREQSSEQDD